MWLLWLRWVFWMDTAEGHRLDQSHTRLRFTADKGNPDTPHPQKWETHCVLAEVLLKQNMQRLDKLSWRL